jgi:eukaryotic-like serine/threonine-protein kinase
MGGPPNTSSDRATWQGPANVDSAAKPLLGKVIDQRYRVLAHIGSGGMADIYEVEHTILGRHVAMKVLRHTRASNPQLVRRFTREARAASRLSSEHVVSIYDYGELPEGSPYFVMDLLRGRNLRQELEECGSLPVMRATNLAIDVCLGLNAAHGAGLVHRDLKPENLWLSRGDDGLERCILLDFGVARFEGTHSTGPGTLIGTARYMSPEQIEGDQVLTPRSDLFSLGVILYECLTGTSPFATDSLERTLFRILKEDPPPIFELVPNVTLGLWKVLERMLAKQPEQRFESALALAVSLRPFAGGARTLPAASPREQLSFSDDTIAEAARADAEISLSEPASIGHTLIPRGGPRTVWSFILGLGVGGTALGTVGVLREHPTAPPNDAAATKATFELSSAPASVLPPITLPVGSPAAAASEGLATSKPSKQPPPLPPSPVRVKSPPRPEPPRPDFDGRNPYLP